MTILWKIQNVPDSVIQKKELVAELVMTELGIDSEEYEVEENISGSPFPMKIKWWQTSKRLCIYDATINLHESSFDVRIRPLNLIYGPLIFPLILVLINGIDGLLLGLIIYAAILLIFGLILTIELQIAKHALKEKIKTAANTK